MVFIATAASQVREQLGLLVGEEQEVGWEGPNRSEKMRNCVKVLSLLTKYHFVLCAELLVVVFVKMKREILMTLSFENRYETKERRKQIIPALWKYFSMFTSIGVLFPVCPYCLL